MLMLFDEDHNLVLKKELKNFDEENPTVLSVLNFFDDAPNVRLIDGLTVATRKMDILEYHISLVVSASENIAVSYLNLIKELITKNIQKAEITRRYQKKEAYTSALFNAVKAGIIATDLGGNIIYVNKRICKSLKINKEQLTNISIKALIPNWSSIFNMASLGNIVKNKETIVTTKHISLKFNIEVSSIIDSNNTKLGFGIIFRTSEKNLIPDNKNLGMVARYTFDDIIGKSKTLKQIIEYAQTIADSPSTILIEGESGTGKEVFAQSIHNASGRKINSFVAINCAAIPENLIESELFGYDDGAFTGAKKGGQPGKFELANKGTLFLDEIGDMKPDMQVKLLRTIQESSVTRVGGERVIPVDVRIIAATNKNLLEEVERGHFRMDLYYRISVIPLHIPSLRERKGDLPALIRFFLNKKSSILQKEIPQMGYSMLQQLLDYDWPGNVRELENFIEQLVNFNGEISLDSFQKLKQVEQMVKNTSPTQPEILINPNSSLKDMEKNHIINTLKHLNGNISKTAKVLDISRNTLYLKLKKYKINVSSTQS